MKKHFSLLLSVSLVAAIFYSCNKEESSAPGTPELPPIESMSINFSEFKVDSKTDKSAIDEVQSEVYSNYAYSAINVGYWNIILTVHLVIPVTAFASSFGQDPVYLGNNKWEWSYVVNGFSSEYTARLTGEKLSEEVKWEMYLTKTGIGAFSELKWFEGTSATDGLSGSWSINRDATNPHPYISINWQKTNDEIGNIRYENVEEETDAGIANPYLGSYITMELQDASYDAKYDIHVYDPLSTNIVEVNIEWSRSELFGRVSSQSYFNDNIWHCWNNYGENITCESGSNGETGTLSDPRGQTYKTVTIGQQVWMAENLRADKYNDGTAIPEVTDGGTWLQTFTPAYCWYDNDKSTNSDPYGALYNWYTVETRKLCPTGWHIPSNEEWDALTEFLGGEEIAGGKLKEKGFEHWLSPNTGATNETQFSAVAAGYRSSTTANSPFLSLAESGTLWSANEYNSGRAWCRFMEYNNTYLQSVRNTGKQRGFSVRCVKD